MINSPVRELLSVLPVIIDHLDEILRGFTEIGILLIAYADLPARMCRETVEPDPLRMLLYIVVWMRAQAIFALTMERMVMLLEVSNRTVGLKPASWKI